MSRKGTKMGLGAFLQESSGPVGPSLDNLPRGPRERAEDDGGYRSRRPEREPMRSEGSGGWRGDRDREPLRSEGSGGWRGDRGDRGDRGGFGDRFGDRPRRDDRVPEERPAHLRLNLSRRGEEPAGSARPASSGAGYDADDKFARSFARFGGGDRRQDSGRFGDSRGGYGDRYGDRDGGRFNDRDSGRYGDRSRYNDRDGGRFGDRDGGRFGRYDEDRLASQFDRQTIADPQPDPAEAARLKKEEEKAAREAEKKRKEEEKKEAKRLAEEAAQKAAEEKKAAAAAAAAKAAKDEELIKSVLATGKKGAELAKVAKTQLKGITPAVVMAQVLEHNQETAISGAKWLTPDEYGSLLEVTIGTANPKDQLKALYALQLFMHEHRGREGNRTKGMMESSFKALYAFDIIADEAFIEYKYDVEDTTPGKMQAIIETSEWLSWLESYEPSDDEEEEED